MILKMSSSDEGTSTSRVFTEVRSFSSVNSNMSFQIPFLAECLVAILIWTLIGSFASLKNERKTNMSAFVNLKTTMSREGFSALYAAKGFM